MADMPVGAAFNVRILDSASPAVAIHTASSDSNKSNYTLITHPAADGKPNVLVFFTPNLNPGGGRPVYNALNTGVWYYAADTKKWSIYNERPANGNYTAALAMPTGVRFNIEVLERSASGGAFMHVANASNTPTVLPSFGQCYTIIDNPLTNGNPGAILFVAHNWSPPEWSGPYLDSPLAVNYLPAEQKWAIVATSTALTASPMPVTTSRSATFNVLVTSGEVATRCYVGESATGSIQGALERALQQLDQDLAAGGVFDALATWEIVEITGWRGGIAGFNTVRVKISATRSPSW
jgi:enamine deaminase RidA (YjgF/YER057c/UK114 family)